LKWFTVTPNPIPPGGLAELIVRANYASPEPVSLTLETGRGSRLSFETPLQQPPGEVEYTAFSDDLKTAHIYYRGSRPSRLSVNAGSDGKLEIFHVAGDFYYLKHTPKKTLTPGEALILRLYDSERLLAAAGIRVWGSPFSIGICGKTDTERLERYAGLGFNTVYGFGVVGARRAALMDKHGLCFAGQTFRDNFREYGQYSCRAAKTSAEYPNLFAYYLRDEVDGAEYKSGLPLGAFGMEMAMARNFCVDYDPERMVLHLLDATHTPANYFTYGRQADLTVIDPYVIMNRGLKDQRNDLSLPWKAAREALAAARPRPVLTDLYVCRGGCGEGDRFPSPEELWTEVVYALGGGSKGIWYYMFDNDREGGAAESPALVAGIHRCNAVMMRLSAILGRSCPVPLESEAGPGIWSRTLIMGERYLALTLVNTKSFSDRSGFNPIPERGVTVKMSLPEYFSAAGVFDVTAGGGLPLKSRTAQNGKTLSFTLDLLDDAKIILLSADGGMPSPERFTVPRGRRLTPEISEASAVPIVEYDFKLPADKRCVPDISGHDLGMGITGAEYIPMPRGRTMLKFDAEKKHIAQLGDNPLLAPGKSLSVVMRAQISSLPGAGGRALTKYNAYSLAIWRNRPAMEIWLRDPETGGVKAYGVTCGREMTPGRSHILAGVFDGGSKTLRLYMDGELCGENILSVPDGSCPASGDGVPLELGGSEWLGGHANVGVDYLAIHRRALNSDEVKKLRNDLEIRLGTEE
jgi:hypothetical protein